MKRTFSASLIIAVYLVSMTCVKTDAQQKFRKAIFFHHSTGGNIYSLTGAHTSAKQECHTYTVSHNLTGSDTVWMNDMWYPGPYVDNGWINWWDVFRGDTLPSVVANYPVIVIKACFSESQIIRVGGPSDTLNLREQTIYNYKYLWRKLIRKFSNHPDRFFVLWTPAPLISAQNSVMYTNALLFTRWAKDTLPQGLDAELLVFPKNVYVFDYFRYAADANGVQKTYFAEAADNSHPNAMAVDSICPKFVKEVFDASINYELNGLKPIKNVSVSPKTVNVGSSSNIASFSANVAYLDNSSVEMTRGGLWVSLDTTIAKVSSPGNILAVNQGSAKIVFSYGGFFDTATIIAEPSRIQSVSLSPSMVTVQPRSTLILTPAAINQYGSRIVPAPAFTWACKGSGSISNGTFTAGSTESTDTITITLASTNYSAFSVIRVANVFYNIKIAFKPAGATAISGYISDNGLPFGSRNNYSYGWSADLNPNNALVQRTEPANDPKYCGVAHMMHYGVVSWQIELPNGGYNVKIGGGDANYFDSDNKILVENVLVVNKAISQTNHHYLDSGFVTVSDGNLTLTNAPNAVNNKISFIEISGPYPSTNGTIFKKNSPLEKKINSNKATKQESFNLQGKTINSQKEASGLQIKVAKNTNVLQKHLTLE